MRCRSSFSTRRIDPENPFTKSTVASPALPYQYRVSSIPVAIAVSAKSTLPVSSIEYPCNNRCFSSTGLTSIEYPASSIPAITVVPARPALPVSSIQYPASQILLIKLQITREQILLLVIPLHPLLACVRHFHVESVVVDDIENSGRGGLRVGDAGDEAAGAWPPAARSRERGQRCGGLRNGRRRHSELFGQRQ